MRFTFEEESELESEQENIFVTKGCGLYAKKKTHSLLGESLVSESFLPSKQEEVTELWANYQECRYRVLSQSEAESVLLHPDGHEFTVLTVELSDVGTHRQSEKERVCGSCGLPWSICVVGGLKPDGTPY